MRKYDFEQILYHLPDKKCLRKEDIDKSKWEREYCYVNFSGLHENLRKKKWQLDINEDEDYWYQYIMFFIISKAILGNSQKLLTNKKMLTVKSQKTAKVILEKLNFFSNYAVVMNEFYDVEFETLQKFARSGQELLY